MKRRLPRSIDGLTRLVFKLDEDRARLKRELESAEKQVASNQEEITRLRHLVTYPDFNLPAALAIVKERDEWKTNYEIAQRKLSELMERMPGEPTFVDHDFSWITRPDRRTWWEKFTAFAAECLRW